MTEKQIYVEKRNGTRELFDAVKIKKSIEFAVEGTGANALELESKFDRFLKNGIKTGEIQKNIIHHAVQLATPSTPEWIKVAGRALAMDMWANFKLRGKSFLEVVLYNIRKGEYAKELLDYYSEADIEYLGTLVNHERDLEHTYSSLVTVANKYLGRFELNQHMHMVTAMRFGQMEPSETRLDFVAKTYDILSLRKLSLATPFMSNLRKGGNVASCFIISIDDDLDSIFENTHRVAKISKNGGGLGIYLGNIRAKGSSVNGAPNASGTVVQWVKIINDTLVAVNQSFTGDTSVETITGDRPISDITEGDLVKTHTGEFKPVTAVRVRDSDTPIMRVTTELGQTRVTQGHPVLVVDKTDEDMQTLKQKIKSGETKAYWVDAKDLKTTHLIIKPQ